VKCVCDVVPATAERLEGGWDREPSEKPGPLWIMLDLQVTTEKSASSFQFSHSHSQRILDAAYVLSGLPCSLMS
jgi:hypothetical protein